ncbi:ROK family protein [candidate division KSB1 bacterium]|nr:ROK family protein [candidate division KSB1 bacterium]NIS27674.1 ROK family protein [candidate division KSB1 bacterium]NIU23748.1 ROK family protein [candidate division KSB1 bacterium]NIU91878.1 ROK family protein [candidate division KSB1 bacterium]NIV93941.1 ROK family protein [candidate division KSB1 bacterium]
MSRIHLSKLSKLNKSTVSSIVSDLLEEKLISETMIGQSTGGRKPILLSLNRAEYRIGAIDFDPDCTYVAIGDIEARVIRRKKIKTESGRPLAFIKKCLNELLEMKKELNCANLKSIGMSIPGIVDTRNGLIVIAPDLRWKNLDIRKIVHEVDPNGIDGRVLIENEANSSALAEQWFGQDMVKNKSNIVFISEGIGTGIILNKELIQGSFDAAGQFGHMTIDPDGELCICGNRGCWEVYTSKDSTARRFGGRSFNGSTNGELGKITALAKNGDKLAIKTLVETGRYLGIGISNIIKAIDPEVIILGGAITQAWDVIYPEIAKEIEARVFVDIKKKDIPIIPTSLVERSSLIGAFALVIREIFRGYRITRG